jgi:small GTP-binding protein
MDERLVRTRRCGTFRRIGEPGAGPTPKDHTKNPAVEKVLTQTQSQLVALERRLILRVRDAIVQAGGAPDDLARLAALVHEMDELFLLVVVGEYNAGKSTFINALLGDDVFETGDLPTTRVISLLRHGVAGPSEPAGEHLRVYRYPLDFLRDLEIVDTPGTNSLQRVEEQITRDFVPRADLVLFVTSLLQPLTASELDFLAHIQEWGKKIIFVVNGTDRRNSDEQLERVRQYIRGEVIARLGGWAPVVYVVSALWALRAKQAARGGSRAAPPSDPLDEFPALERYLIKTLRETERVRLKLLSPLGVLRNVLQRNQRSLQGRLEVVREDGHVLRSIRDQLAQYVADMEGDSSRYLTDMRNALYDVERRGRDWFEDTVRITNINFLRNKDAVENRFRNEVVADAPGRIEEVVQRMVDWMVRNNMKLWNAALGDLQAHTERLREKGALAPEGDTEFHYNREELFARLRHPVEHRLGQFDVEREARQIVSAVKESVTRTFGVEALAVGLGSVLVAIFTTAALDLSGVLTATLLALAGFLILPARRRKLIRDLGVTIAKLNADLAELLSSTFREQLGRYERQMLEVIEPYERFLATEEAKVERSLAEFKSSWEELGTVTQQVTETFPEPQAESPIEAQRL